MKTMELFWRPLRHQLGAEELLELGRPVRMYRYAHTPFLAGRAELPRVAQGNLLQRPQARPALGQAAAPAGTSTLTKVLIIGIPILIVVGIVSFSK
jgi:hypothetical protein